MALTSVAVFLGAHDGNDPTIRTATEQMGMVLAARDIALVYGGGGSGLMGAVSQAVIDAGGKVIGVIPQFMVDREWGRESSEQVQMHVVDTMHERKAVMSSHADAFVVLPGGLGTLEEMFEVWTWQTLGLHPKPVALLNVNGYWDPLIEMLWQMVRAGFVSRELMDTLVVSASVEELLDVLADRVTQAG